MRSVHHVEDSTATRFAEALASLRAAGCQIAQVGPSHLSNEKSAMLDSVDGNGKPLRAVVCPEEVEAVDRLGDETAREKFSVSQHGLSLTVKRITAGYKGEAPGPPKYFL